MTGVDFEHANARAVIDSGELIEALSGACDALEELHVQLKAMPGLWLLVALPARPVGLRFWLAGSRFIP